MDNPEIKEGVEIIESIWYFMAISIVEMAIKIYGLNEEQAQALKDVYLKQNNYFVVLKN